MDDRWVVLYKKLEKIEEEFLSAENRNDLMPIRENLSEIQEFAVWFMKEKYVIDGKNWEEQQKKLLDILQDIVIAIEQQDCVLMHDAITYGIMKYIYTFLPDMTEER